MRTSRLVSCAFTLLVLSFGSGIEIRDPPRVAIIGGLIVG